MTAKVAIKPHAGTSRTGSVTEKCGKKGGPAGQGETCWISATPMLDFGDHVGVWMIVIVDKMAVASNTHPTIDSLAQTEAEVQLPPAILLEEEMPIKPTPVGQMDEVQENVTEEIIEGEDIDAGKSRRLDGDLTTSEILSIKTDGLPESPNGSPRPDLQLQSPEPEAAFLPALDSPSPDTIFQGAEEDSPRTQPIPSANGDALSTRRKDRERTVSAYL